MGMLQDMVTAQNGAPPTSNNQGGDPQQAAEGTTSEAPKELMDIAVEALYGDNFEGMVRMFQDAGKEGFSNTMATVVTGVLNRVEKEAGEVLTPDTAAQVGVGVFEMLLEDLAEGEVLPQNLDKQDVLGAIQGILQSWVQTHPDQVDEGEMRSTVENIAQSMYQSGQLQEGEVTPPGQVAPVSPGGGQQMPMQQAQPTPNLQV